MKCLICPKEIEIRRKTKKFCNTLCRVRHYRGIKSVTLNPNSVTVTHNCGFVFCNKHPNAYTRNCGCCNCL